MTRAVFSIAVSAFALALFAALKARPCGHAPVFENGQIVGCSCGWKP